MDRPIVVGVSAGPTPHPAVQWAGQAADQWQRTLLLAQATNVPDHDDTDRRRAGPERAGRATLEILAAALRQSGVDCDIRTLPRDQEPCILLVALSAEAEMIVVGAGDHKRLAAMVLGSPAWKVAAHARCPAVIVPAGWTDQPAAPRPAIVVGVSDSASGIAALGFAFTHATAAGGEILALRAVQDRPTALDQAVLDRAVAAALARRPSASVVSRLVSGPAETALRAAASTADLLVIGCRHPSRLRRSRLGPLASRLAYRMPCPVAIIADTPR